MNWIVTIARNNLSLTKNAVASFLAQDVPVRVLVINNASSDGTAEWLQSRKDLWSVNLTAPSSVARCWNTALKWLFKTEDHVLVANNDVVLRPETYRLLLEDGGLFVTAVGVDTKEQMNEDLQPENRRPHPDYSCWMMRREVWDRSLYFDERFKIAFCEDSAHHATLHRNGVRAYCIGVPFYHVGSATVKNSDPEEKQMICEQADRNRDLFFQLYGAHIGTPEYDTLFSEENFGCCIK